MTTQRERDLEILVAGFYLLINNKIGGFKLSGHDYSKELIAWCQRRAPDGTDIVPLLHKALKNIIQTDLQTEPEKNNVPIRKRLAN